VTLAQLNELAPAQAQAALRQCCGSRKWVQRMTALRPFATTDDVLRAADRAAMDLTTADWLEAFAAHPRIGERSASAWSQAEQAAALQAAQSVQDRLALGNAQYEDRFGFIFIVFASGKTPEQMLEIMHRRMDNDRETEIRNAAQEQQKITRARLNRLLEP
jgi:OHCU decarboxylase